MQISSQDAIKHGFVRDRNNEPLTKNYNGKSSIDLTVRQIIFKDESESICTLESTFLRPQDSVIVVSEETVHVPDGFVAYVFLKNRLSQRGFLALNTGIIDSNYSGPIATLLINFSDIKQRLPITDKDDDRFFFRVVFHQIGDLPLDFISKETHVNSNAEKKYSSYHHFRTEELKKFPRSFMQPSILKEQISKELTEKLSSVSLTRIGAMITIVGLLISLIPLARDVYFSEKYDIKEYYDYKAKNQYEIERLNKKIDQLEERINMSTSNNNRNASG